VTVVASDRESVSLHVHVGTGVPAAISGPNTSTLSHVERQFAEEQLPRSVEPTNASVRLLLEQTVRIGRGVWVRLAGFDDDGAARLELDAPRHLAVSRDDFSYQEHLEFQRRREQGARR
jgi:hypothetical protein